MKYKNILNYILSVVCLISWSNLSMAQEKPKPVTSKKIEKCDITKLMAASDALKAEHIAKLNTFDPKSKTVKNKIITDAVSTNIFLVKLLAAQESCKKSSDDEKKWVDNEVEKNIKQLKIYTNSYCKAVILPGNDQKTKSSAETGELGPDKDGGCKSNAERRMVKFVFNACTPDSEDYDIKLCQCHMEDRGNSCLYEKNTVEKLIKKIEAVPEDKICDEKTPQSKSSFFDNKNLIDILKVGALIAALYLGYKFLKKKVTKDSETQASNSGGTTAGGAKTPSGGKSYKGTYSGTVNMPGRQERRDARDTSIRHKGYTVTGNDAIDNATLKGGTPDGGIYMAGSYTFTVDANNQITSGNFVIHGHNLPLGGGLINSDGSFSITPLGLQCNGRILSNGKLDGVVNEHGMDWVKGYFDKPPVD